MYTYKHSSDSYLILKVFIQGNTECTLDPREAVGCMLRWGGGTGLEPSWDKELVQHFPSTKGCSDTCPAPLPVAQRWSWCHGAQPRAAFAPQSSAAPWCSEKGGVQPNGREDGSWHHSLSSCLFSKCLHSPHLYCLNPCYIVKCSLKCFEHVIRKKKIRKF